MSGDDLYRNPGLYDLEYADKVDDVGWYTRLARGVSGPVAELGCGNGRITVPLARAGVRVTGVDNAPAMLADLEHRLDDEPHAVRSRVRTVRASFCELDLPPVHDLVLLPFNALHHCHSHQDLLNLLDGVRRALAPGGRFALDCYLPDPRLYERDPDGRYEQRDFIDPRTGKALRSWETGWYDAQAQIHHVIYIYRDHQGEESQVHLALRMFYPQELRALIDWGGFRIVHETQDFEGSPLTGESLSCVLVLEPR